MAVAGNSKRVRFSNSNDAFVTIFFDGRLKVSSPKYAWRVDRVERHNTFGQSARLVPDWPMSAPDGVEFGTQIALDPTLEDAVAATVVCSNGNFIQFEHGGAIVVGNDSRDVEEKVNGYRDSTGSSFQVRFDGTYLGPQTRAWDHYVEFVETKSKAIPRYPNEIEIKDEHDWS